MLLFSTVLDVNEKLTKEAFVKLIIEWNQSSTYQSNIIPDIEWDGDYNIRYGNDKVWLEIVEYRNKNIVAVRYEKKDDNGAIWDSDYVVDFSEMKMSIRLDRSYIEDAPSVSPKFSTPHFISMMIAHGYLASDSDLAVTRTPVVIDDEQINMMADIIKGQAHYCLPIVFISKTSENDDPVDISLIASRLKGVAHVLVQKSVQQNESLQLLCDNQNEFYGAIGIYYPTKTAGHQRFLYHNSYGRKQIVLEKVVRAVIQYCNSQSIATLYTWQGVKNAILSDRLESQREERIAAELARKNAEKEYLRLLDEKDEEQRLFKKKAMEDARAEADVLIDSFDEDIAKMQKQIEELTKANEALRYENQGLRAKYDTSDTFPVLFSGEENDFYQGEIKDLILSMLSDSLDRLPHDSRRRDIITDILRNNEYKEISKERAANIKNLLKNYDGMSGKVRQVLEDLGFVLTEEGKHIKAAYYGDGRYLITFPKTPSDNRTGKNLTSEIINICF